MINKEQFWEEIKEYNDNKSKEIVLSVLKKHFSIPKALQHIENIYSGYFEEIDEIVLKEVAHGLGINLNNYFEIKKTPEEIRGKLIEIRDEIQEVKDKIQRAINSI